MKFVDQVESFYRNKKAEGGIMTSMPVGYKMGTRKGDLVGDKEKGITSIKIGLMEESDRDWETNFINSSWYVVLF